MKKHFVVTAAFCCFGLLLVATALTVVTRANSADTRLTGYVTDTWCGVNRDTKAPSATCTNFCVKSKGAKYAFYNFADKKVYVLNPQSIAAEYAGEMVVISGTIGSDTQKFENMRGTSEAQTITASSISKSR